MKWIDCFNLGFDTSKKFTRNYIFDYFATPEESNGIEFDRENFFKYLIVSCGEFESGLSNTIDICLKLESFSRIHLDSWQKIFNALTAEYNPIENYNRYDKGNVENVNKGNSKENVAGFDSGELVENSEINNSQETTLTQDTHSYGNIGVMSSQDLVNQEIELRKNTIYDIIVSDFKEFCCILIY